jgi:UDP-glucose 4-epimerase
MAILLTGGAGYIGSHVAHTLCDADAVDARPREVVVLDDLSTGKRSNVPDTATFIEGNVGDAGLLERLFDAHDIDGVCHFAASTNAPESVDQPLAYYRNNTIHAHTLIEACIEAGVSRFVFSSTAAIYGQPDEIPIDEDVPADPLNPYGRSKRMVEQMLEDTADAHDPFRFHALRYFNVAGSDPDGRVGHAKDDATTLIKVVAQVATGKRDHLEIYGTDYPTRDGTGVRDYIHVTDLAEAHRHALVDLEAGGESAILNCGYGHGYSVFEVVEAARRVSNRPIDIREVERRPGDPAKSVADASRLRERFGWTPAHDDLDAIVRSAIEWERHLA